MKGVQKVWLIIPLVLAVCIICFCGCESVYTKFFFRSGTLGRTDYYEAYYIIDVNVPAFNSTIEDATKFDKVELMETDEYGRSMFRYCSHVGTMGGDWEWETYVTTLVVCQKKEGEKAYYYPDYCWLSKFSEKGEGFAAFTEEEISLLKERNDWGEPINFDQMQSILCQNDREYWHPVEDEVFQDLVREYLNLDSGGITARRYLEKNKSGMQIVWCQVDANQYFCLLDTVTPAIQVCEPFDGDILTCQDALHAFKEKNGFCGNVSNTTVTNLLGNESKSST